MTGSVLQFITAVILIVDGIQTKDNATIILSMVWVIIAVHSAQISMIGKMIRKIDQERTDTTDKRTDAPS